MNQLGWSNKQCILKLFPLIITISFAMDVFVPAIPEMGDYFSVSVEKMQASLYLFMLTVAFGQLCIGPLADRFGRRRLAQLTAVLFLGGSILSAIAVSMSVLLLGRIIQAIGACGTYLLCFIVIRDNFPTEVCGRLFSLLTGTNAIAASTAPIIGGILLDLTQNWRSGFYFLIWLGIVIMLNVHQNMPDYQHKTIKASQSVLKQWQQICTNTHFLKYTLIASTGMLGLYLFCALSPEILMTDLKLTGTAYGLWFGLNATTAFMANFIAAKLTYYKSLRYIVRLGMLIMLLAVVVMLGLNLTHTTVLRFMLPMLCTTVGIGMSMGCATALALRDFEAMAGTATALVSACQFSLAGVVGVVITCWPLGPMSFVISMLGFILFNCWIVFLTSEFK